MTYAGEVTPSEAFEALANDLGAVLVDVRTRPELAYVGYPDLSALGKQVIPIEWQQFPSGAQNPRFVEELRAVVGSDDVAVYFVCRSGARSRFAAIAATGSGFRAAYNVTDGFEGPLDTEGHRGVARGWKAAGLPWRQS